MQEQDPLLSKLHYGWRIEQRAWEWYSAQVPGARLLGRNFRCRVGEIDLIVEEPVEEPVEKPSEGGAFELVFIEVRARTSASWESGLESLRPAKLLHLRRALDSFLMKYRGPAQTLRVDLIAWDGRQFSQIRNLRF